MTQTLAKYHIRSPRYVLQAHDNTLVRLAGPQQSPWEEGTEIRNISLTGLGFSAPADLCPLLGEIIKIEFEVPSSTRMACYALVTRLDPLGHSQMMVGVKFYRLNLQQRIYLAQGLASQLKIQQSQHKALALNHSNHKFVAYFLVAFLLLALALTLYQLL